MLSKRSFREMNESKLECKRSLTNITNGFGKMIYGDGSYYEGGFIQGERNGKGVYKSDTEHYEGQWYNGKLRGVGYFWKLEGQMETKYQGDFYDDLKHGNGTFEKMTRLNGGYENIKYSGNFNNDLPSEYGEYKIIYNCRSLATYISYSGNYLNNNRDGDGTLIEIRDISSNLFATYISIIHPNVKKLTFNDIIKHFEDFSEKYQNYKIKITEFTGNFKSNKKHGNGIENFFNGNTITKYEGKWNEDVKTGPFKAYTKNNSKKSYFIESYLNNTLVTKKEISKSEHHNLKI